MQVQNCTKHTPPRQGEECPKCQIDHLRAVNADLLDALEDMLSGWRYIRENHGDLYGVGWDRCEESAKSAIARAKD